MFVYLGLFIIFKYFLKFGGLDTQSLLIYSTLIVIFLFFAEKNLTWKRWNNKIDSLLFNNLILQNFLAVSLKFESLCNSDHFLVGTLSRWSIMPLTYFFIQGLVVFYLGNIPTSPVEFLEVFLVFWIVLYIRLRGRYLNYIQLQVDGPQLYWSELLEKLQQTQKFSITNKLVENPCFQLFSFSYRPYIKWKADVRVAYQTRGVKMSVATAVKEAAPILKDNLSQIGKFVVGVLGVGGMCYASKIQADGAVRAAQIQADGAVRVAEIQLKVAEVNRDTARYEYGKVLVPQGQTLSDTQLVEAEKPILSESDVVNMYSRMDNKLTEAFAKATTQDPKNPPTNLSFNGDSSLDFLDVFFI